jgi:threonyl-tRNA synthetase
VVIPIRDSHNAYAEEIASMLQEKGTRFQVDQRNESLNKRIREGTVKKIPYLLIIGDKEVESRSVSPRAYGQGDIGSMGIDEFLVKLERDINNKR